MNTDTFEVRTVFDSRRTGPQSPMCDLLPDRGAHADAVVTIVAGIPRRHYTTHVQLWRDCGLSSGVVAASDKRKSYPWQAETFLRASHPYSRLTGKRRGGP